MQIGLSEPLSEWLPSLDIPPIITSYLQKTQRIILS